MLPLIPVLLMDFLRADVATQQTRSTELAAALGAMGISPLRERPWRRQSGASEATTYFFEQRSPCGNYETAPLVRAWDDHEWQRARPRHPLSYIRIMFRNASRYRDWESSGTRIGAIRRAEKIELLTLVEGRPLRGEQNPAVDGPHVETDSFELAMALLALGISPAPGLRWTRRGPHRFRFMAADPLARFATAPLMLAWQTPDWWAANPEHPFAYLICAAANKRWLLEKIRGTAPVCVIKQANGLPAFLASDAGDDAQRAFFRQLKG